MPKNKKKTPPAVAATESLKNVEEQAIVSENVAAIETVAVEEPVAVVEEPVVEEPVVGEPVVKEPVAEDQWIEKTWGNISVYFNVKKDTYTKVKPDNIVSTVGISREECRNIYTHIK